MKRGDKVVRTGISLEAYGMIKGKKYVVDSIQIHNGGDILRVRGLDQDFCPIHFEVLK